MHENEKAPAGAGTPTRAVGKGLTTGFPVSDSITAVGNRQFKADEVEGQEQWTFGKFYSALTA